MSGYWPWWAGALALGSIATLHAKLTGRTLGVSGAMAKVAHPIEEREAERIQEEMDRDRAALMEAMLAATKAEFGDDAQTSVRPPAGPTTRSAPLPAPFLGNVVFLIAIGVGAMIATLARGTAHASFSLGPVHEHYFGRGAGMFAALAVGGVLVGAGTRMSGGCTSGHGLSGTARLVPASLIATGTFMAAAVAVSFLLAKVFP